MKVAELIAKAQQVTELSDLGDPKALEGLEELLPLDVVEAESRLLLRRLRESRTGSGGRGCSAGEDEMEGAAGEIRHEKAWLTRPEWRGN